jgi:hypothetical protein
MHARFFIFVVYAEEKAEEFHGKKTKKKIKCLIASL